MTNLGRLYDKGQGVFQNYGVAKEWYEKASAAGNIRAMFYVGFLYEGGHGVEQNHTTATEWYEKAAAAGSEEAKERLNRIPEIHVEDFWQDS